MLHFRTNQKSGNIFLVLLRLLILICTLFLYTTANGYYVIMERATTGKRTDSVTTLDTDQECTKCGNAIKAEDTFCENCGNKINSL